MRPLRASRQNEGRVIRGTTGHLAIALLLGAALVACSDEEPGNPRPPSPRVSQTPTPPSPTGEAVTVEGCPDASQVIGDEDLRVTARLSADVDGDGNEDASYIHVDQTAPLGCQAFLIVETSSAGMHAAPTWEIGDEGGLTEPSFNVAVQINEEPGLELVVNEIAGASTQFVGVYTFTDGRLVRIGATGIEPELWPAQSDSLFPFGGSVGHLEAVDCFRGEPGTVVVTTGSPAAERAEQDQVVYRVTRRVLRLHDDELALDDVIRARVEVNDLFEEFPEYTSSPFGSCPIEYAASP